MVILQHPREARLAICTAWLTRLALPSSELHRGVRFEQDARVREVAADPGAALLFPGDGAVPAAARADDPPPLLIAVDGTWHQATEILQANPAPGGAPQDLGRARSPRRLRRAPPGAGAALPVHARGGGARARRAGA